MAESADGGSFALPTVLLYTSGPDCSLCQRTELDLELLAELLAFELLVVDLKDVPDVAPTYRDRVPVVLLDDALVAEGRIGTAALREALAGCAPRGQGSGPPLPGPVRPPPGQGASGGRLPPGP